MKVLCEMKIVDFFWLSTGHVVIVCALGPDMYPDVPNNSKADLCISDRKILPIRILGTERLSYMPGVKRDKKVFRTDTPIPMRLVAENNMKLVIYKHDVLS